ncbi:hypothetical protein [Sulfitobacter sp. 915]|uniref:hypothetical protein n=1 Tax=Sulfitobacter sp. 915 TaxID=3368558 RepID=UPI00374689DD
MKFSLKMKRFARDEDGAVTVDWVVLTAAVVALAAVAFGSIETSTSNLATGIAAKITEAGN